MVYSEDDADSYLQGVLGLDVNDLVQPMPGGPFSALTSTMWPQDLITKLGQQSEDPNSQPDYRYETTKHKKSLNKSYF